MPSQRTLAAGLCFQTLGNFAVFWLRQHRVGDVVKLGGILMTIHGGTMRVLLGRFIWPRFISKNRSLRLRCFSKPVKEAPSATVDTHSWKAGPHSQTSLRHETSSGHVTLVDNLVSFRKKSTKVLLVFYASETVEAGYIKFSSCLSVSLSVCA